MTYSTKTTEEARRDNFARPLNCSGCIIAREVFEPRRVTVTGGHVVIDDLTPTWFYGCSNTGIDAIVEMTK